MIRLTIVEPVFDSNTWYGQGNRIAAKVSSFVENLTSGPAFSNINVTNKLKQLIDSEEKMDLPSFKTAIDNLYKVCGYKEKEDGVHTKLEKIKQAIDERVGKKPAPENKSPQLP